MFVEAARLFVFRMHHDRSNSDDVRSGQRTSERVTEERGTEPLALPSVINRKPSEQHYRDRMTRQTFAQTFWRLRELHACRAEAIISNLSFAQRGNIGIGSAGGLIGERKASQKTVERFDTAVERLKFVALAELFDAGFCRNVVGAQSSTLGSLSSRSRRGLALGGASRAA